jgi:hypothetical protein
VGHFGDFLPKEGKTQAQGPIVQKLVSFNSPRVVEYGQLTVNLVICKIEGPEKCQGFRHS